LFHSLMTAKLADPGDQAPPTLPAVVPKKISGRGQNVGHAMNEFAAAVAVEIDREFKIGRRHELSRADFAGPGAARTGRQVAALNVFIIQHRLGECNAGSRYHEEEGVGSAGRDETGSLLPRHEVELFG
jgi:hypothetical protein